MILSRWLVCCCALALASCTENYTTYLIFEGGTAPAIVEEGEEDATITQVDDPVVVEEADATRIEHQVEDASVPTVLDGTIADAEVEASLDAPDPELPEPVYDPKAFFKDMRPKPRLRCPPAPETKTCTAGPNYAVLAIDANSGTLLAFDPALPGDPKVLSAAPTSSTSTNGSHIQVTQGPDNCLWVLRSKGIERWDTNGVPLPSADVLNPAQVIIAPEPRSLFDGVTSFAFQNGAMFLATRSGVLRIPAPETLPAGQRAKVTNYASVGQVIESFLFTRDGELLVHGASSSKVYAFPKGATAERAGLGVPFIDFTKSFSGGQMAVDGNGTIAIRSSSRGGELRLYELTTGAEKQDPLEVFGTKIGGEHEIVTTSATASVDGGRWLLGAISDLPLVISIDPAAEFPSIYRHEYRQTKGYPRFQMFGEACLP